MNGTQNHPVNLGVRWSQAGFMWWDYNPTFPVSAVPSLLPSRTTAFPRMQHCEEHKRGWKREGVLLDVPSQASNLNSFLPSLVRGPLIKMYMTILFPLVGLFTCCIKLRQLTIFLTHNSLENSAWKYHCLPCLPEVDWMLQLTKTFYAELWNKISQRILKPFLYEPGGRNIPLQQVTFHPQKWVNKWFHYQ